MRKRRTWHAMRARKGSQVYAYDMREAFTLNSLREPRTFVVVINQIVSGARIHRVVLGQIKYCDDYRARWI